MVTPRIIYKTLLESFDKCGRYGWLKYFFLGQGVESRTRGPEMSIGSAIHKGVETIWKTGDLIKACMEATFEYEGDVVFPEGVHPDVIATVKTEHLLVIEAVLRFWFTVRYPALLAEYEFVNSEYKILTPISPALTLLAKPDAILKSRLDSRYLNWSLKTEKSHNRIKHPAALIDYGGLTESISAAVTVGNGDLKNISGTMMEYLVVGTMDEDEIVMWNPLIHGWRRESKTGMGGFEYAWRWKFTNPDYDPMGPKSPSKNPKETSLKKKDGWERFNAVDYENGLGGWINDLVAGKFIPYHINPMDELIMVPPVYTRTATATAEFLEEAIADQTLVSENAAKVAAGTMSLAAAFPKRRGNCLRYGEQYRCEMWGICHEGYGTDPYSNGYRKRLTSAEREASRRDKI